MALLIGEKAPDFTQDSTEGPLNFYQWLGNSWCILFSHPKDFTPVCTTELGEVSRLKDEFARRNVKVLGLSVDSREDHLSWAKDIEETQGVPLNFPLIADHDRKVSHLYQMIHPAVDDSFTVRSVFIVDHRKSVRLVITYPASTGRNFSEILRVVDSLQLTDKFSVATPVNWKKGEDVIIIPSLTDKAELEKKFPKGYHEVKPYLRTTPQPDL